MGYWCWNPVVTADGTCSGSKKSCSFTIKQTLCIEIPISFGAKIDTGDAVVSCGGITKEGCDCFSVLASSAKDKISERSIFSRR